MLEIFIYYCVLNLVCSSLTLLYIGKYKTERYTKWEKSMEKSFEEDGYVLTSLIFTVLSALLFLPLAIYVRFFYKGKK